MSEEKTENTNCLDGMKCPECGALEPFNISVITTVTMSDDGSEFSARGSGDVEWQDDSPCQCLSCQFRGQVYHFRVHPKMNAEEQSLESTLRTLMRRFEESKKLAHDSIPRIIEQLSAIEDLGDKSTLLAFTVGGLTSTLSILIDVIGDIETLAEISLNQLPVREDGPRLIDEKRIPGREE